MWCSLHLVNLPFDYKSVSDIFGCLFWLKIYLDANPNIVLDYHAETHADAPVYCVFGPFSRGRINKNVKVLKYLTWELRYHIPVSFSSNLLWCLLQTDNSCERTWKNCSFEENGAAIFPGQLCFWNNDDTKCIRHENCKNIFNNFTITNKRFWYRFCITPFHSWYWHI